VSSAAAGQTGGEDVAPLEYEERRRRDVGFKFNCGCVGGGENEGDEGIFEEGDECCGLFFSQEMLWVVNCTQIPRHVLVLPLNANTHV
jgi:hypothetical protein